MYTIDVPDDWKVQSRPNPADEQVVLVWENHAGAKQLEIVTSDGSQHGTFQVGQAASYRLETAGWPAGLYFYRLTNEHGSSNWEKLVVTHGNR